MTAAQRFLPLLSGVRSAGDRRWTARCPAHDDRSPSLSIRQADDRVLLRCWAGCTAAKVVAAVGLTLADLYDDARQHSRPTPAADLRRLATQGIERRRQTELQRSAEGLRLRDALSRAITDAVQAGAVTEAEAWDALEEAYAGYSELEYKFERLLRKQDTLALWRESRESRRTA